MKILFRLFGLAALAISTVGCRSKAAETSYPGYSKVGEIGRESYFVDSGSISHTSLSGISFLRGTQIVQHGDGSHSLGPVFVDCEAKTSYVDESATYDASGRVLSSEKAAAQREDAVIAFFCSKLSSIPFIREPYDTKAAVKEFLGGDGSTWKPHIPEGLKNSLDGTSEETFQGSVILDKAFSEAGITKRFVVISSTPVGDYSCHACGALISALILKQLPNGWFEASSNTYLTVAGSFGAPPAVDIERMGPDRYGMSLTAGYAGQGEELEHKDFYAEVGATIQPVLSVETSSSYSGGFEDETAAKTTIDFQPSVTGGFYDIRLESHGTKLNDAGVVTDANSTKMCQMVAVGYKCQ